VWYHPAAIVNIFLSLNNVKKKYRVTFDSELANSFVDTRGMCLNMYLTFLIGGYTTQA